MGVVCPILTYLRKVGNYPTYRNITNTLKFVLNTTLKKILALNDRGVFQAFDQFCSIAGAGGTLKNYFSKSAPNQGVI